MSTSSRLCQVFPSTPAEIYPEKAGKLPCIVESCSAVLAVYRFCRIGSATRLANVLICNRSRNGERSVRPGVQIESVSVFALEP